MPKDTYGNDFFSRRHHQTEYAAETILELVLARLPPIRSALDAGCGVGTWLSVARRRGVDDVIGIDGPYVDRSLLQIPETSFVAASLEDKWPIDRHFDFAMSLEVAEHLRPSSAERFVTSLTEAADFVMFGAAIPFQGGVAHLNEQPQSYWAGLFSARGFAVLDVVRPNIWADNRIPYWYRQNTLLFVRHGRLPDLRPSRPDAPILDLVHPALLKERYDQLGRHRGVIGALRSIRDAAVGRKHT